MKTFNNPSINAKLKAMYSKKLKKEDLEDLMKQNHIKDAIILLKSKIDNLEDLSNEAKRLELENALDNIIIMDIKKINQYLRGNNKKIWQKYILKYKIDTIKKIYENLISQENINIENAIWTNMLFEDLKPLLNTTSQEEFIQQIPNVKIKGIFQTSKNNFELENSLDKYYLESFLQEVKGKNKDIEDILKFKIDLLNILWTYRCKKYYGIVDENILINSFSKIDINTIREVEKITSIEELKQILSSTVYKDIIKKDVEKDLKRALYKKSKRNFRKDILNLNTVFSYFDMIEIEKENIITIIEGIRYKLRRRNNTKKDYNLNKRGGEFWQ